MTHEITSIFVVEDEVMVALELADILGNLGFGVVGPALHQEEAIDMARNADMDAAFLDVNLSGGKTSQPVAEILRERGIRFLFITAYDEKQVTFKTSDEKVFKKPITNDQVNEALRTLLPQLAN